MAKDDHKTWVVEFRLGDDDSWPWSVYSETNMPTRERARIKGKDIVLESGYRARVRPYLAKDKVLEVLDELFQTRLSEMHDVGACRETIIAAVKKL